MSFTRSIKLLVDADLFDEDMYNILVEIRNKKRFREKYSKKRSKKRYKNRNYGAEEMRHLDDATFTRMFRLNRDAFYKLLSGIRGKLECKDPRKIDYISAETRLAVSLRWLAGGSYLDICFAFGISTGYNYQLSLSSSLIIY